MYSYVSLLLPQAQNKRIKSYGFCSIYQNKYFYKKIKKYHTTIMKIFAIIVVFLSLVEGGKKVKTFRDEGGRQVEATRSRRGPQEAFEIGYRGRRATKS